MTRLLRVRGILTVAAIGNEGPGTSRSPGNYTDVLSVGVSTKNDEVAAYSSSQRMARRTNPLVPSLVAPGEEVISCVPSGGYSAWSGGSPSCALVAGLAALLFQAKPDASAAEVERAIPRLLQAVPKHAPRAGRTTASRTAPGPSSFSRTEPFGGTRLTTSVLAMGRSKTTVPRPPTGFLVTLEHAGTSGFQNRAGSTTGLSAIIGEAAFTIRGGFESRTRKESLMAKFPSVRSGSDPRQAASNEAVTPSAVFSLKPEPPEKLVPPDEVEPRVRRLLDNGWPQGHRDRAPGLFHLPEHGRLRRPSAGRIPERLSSQPEIATTTPDEPYEDLLIQPVESHPVE